MISSKIQPQLVVTRLRGGRDAGLVLVWNYGDDWGRILLTFTGADICSNWRYALTMLIQFLWELCCRTLLFPLFHLIYARPPVLGMTLNCIIMPHDYYNNTWHMLMVKIPCIGYNLWSWSINFKALRYQLTTIGDSGYRQHGISTLSQRTSSTMNTLLP